MCVTLITVAELLFFDFDKMNNLVVDLPSGLSSDFEKLYESGKYTDVSIHVGKEPNSKLFFAHASVLCARSTFLETNLTETSESIQKAVVTFEDVTPDVFEVLLRYIYTGRISYDSCRDINWISLLNGANMLELRDLLAVIEKYLINTQTEWIQQNILTVHKYTQSAGFAKSLLSYCDRIITSNPGIIFKSKDIAQLPKETLISLLKNPDLDMNDDDIWMSVVQWAVGQSPGLENDPDNWSSDDINTLKDTIADCISHIKFFNISLKFIALYDDLLPRKLRRNILNYHGERNYKPNTPLPIPAEKHIDSLIINERQAEWISSKIVESTERLQVNQGTSEKQRNLRYKFNLLYRQSRDGDVVAKFRELCNKKGPTIAIGKVADTEEILGGYNPVSWGLKENYVIETKESFIFALNKDSWEESIVSFVVNAQRAIWDNKERFPVFGAWTGGTLINRDLDFGDGKRIRPRASKNAYQVSIRHSEDGFKWTDWEVFSVSTF